MLRKLLLAAALLIPSTAHADWYEASSEHFVVYADDDPAKIKAFSTRLEKYDKAMRVVRVVPERKRGPASRVTVFMNGSVSDIQKLYGGGQQKVAGFYDSRASGSVAFVPARTGSDGGGLSAQRILLHEYAHHFMYNDWPTAIFPRWFSEGFAEFHSTAIFGDDGSVTFGAPPTDRGYGVTLVNQMPLSLMLRPDLTKLSDLQTYTLYSRGWLLTHFLTFDPERRKQLSDYITAINEGKPFDEAAKVFGNLNALDFKLTSYVKRPRFQSIRLADKDLQIGDVTLRKLTAGEAATMPARIRSSRGVDATRAREVVTMARTAAAPYPNDAGAQNALAEAEYDVGNYAGSEGAADRALAADPKSIHALIYKGMSQQAVASKAKSNDVKQWQAIRKWYLAANKVDPEDPQPLILYYRSFGAAQQPPTKNAEAGLIYAQKLAPFDYGLRYTAAKIYLRDNKPEEAKTELRLIGVIPHGGEWADRANKAVAILDKDGAAAALTMVEASEKAANDEAAKKAPEKSKSDD